jgi:beta-lactamase superfamily II metal-dependent hydrolase
VYGEKELHLDVLPARQGDCLLLQWGAGTSRHRMLIDAGPAPAYEGIASRLRGLGDSAIDLLVLTHVDADHIEGVILAVNDSDLGLAIGEAWYNGEQHLTSELNAVHGEILSLLITELAIPWNTSFGGGAVRAPESGCLPVRELPGGLRITVLAPDGAALRRLRDEWWETCQEAGIATGSVADVLAALRARPALRPEHALLSGPPLKNVRELAAHRSGSDPSVPNASSIVLLAEYGETRILLTGDAAPSVLVPAVRRLLAERELSALPLTALKMPHHGSAKNITSELVRCLPASHYLFSTDGSYFKHPDESAVATILENGPADFELVFNYDTPRTRAWEDERLRNSYRYRVRYPEEGTEGIELAWGTSA